MTRRREARDPRLVLRSVLVGGRGGVPGRPLGGPGYGDSEAALTCGRVSAWQLRPNSRSVGPAAPDGLDRERAPAALGFADLLLCCCRHRFDGQSSPQALPQGAHHLATWWAGSTASSCTPTAAYTPDRHTLNGRHVPLSDRPADRRVHAWEGGAHEHHAGRLGQLVAH